MEEQRVARWHTSLTLAKQSMLLIFIVFLFTLRIARVSGPSMEPTLSSGSVVVLSVADYHFRVPRRGDIIAFTHERIGQETYIKRIIAVPGDLVDVRTGELKAGFAKSERRIPPQRYFVLGDNRPRSEDSRRWGLISQTSIVGHARFVLWPFQEIRALP